MIDWIWLDERIGQMPERAWSAVKNGWSNYSTFFSRFNVSGAGKFSSELLSEGMTLGTAGFMVLLMLLCQPLKKSMRRGVPAASTR